MKKFIKWLERLGAETDPEVVEALSWPKAACCSLHAGGAEECSEPQIPTIKKERKPMTERTHYRSKIDELVCKSGKSGLAVAREMGITNNRIIALCRAKDHNISSDDMAGCRAAILRLGGNIQGELEGKLQDINIRMREILELLEEKEL